MLFFSFYGMFKMRSQCLKDTPGCVTVRGQVSADKMLSKELTNDVAYFGSGANEEQLLFRVHTFF